jgi:hypothetical protein
MFDLPEIGPAKGVPCQITLESSHVHIGTPVATFDGTLTGNDISGKWTTPKQYNWGPLPLSLTRSAQSAK